ncbi:recombinase RecT, partial [Brooklawnia cerclae]
PTPAAMWLKSAVRQLAKWVPTSAEYRREQLRAAQDVIAENAGRTAPTRLEQQAAPHETAEGEYVDEVTGEVFTSKPVDAEVVEPSGGAMFPQESR